MHKYQVVEVLPNSNHAGSKAPSDVVEIAEKMGFVPIEIRKYTSQKQNIIAKFLRFIFTLFDCTKLFFQINSNSIILIQYPSFLSGKLGKIIIFTLNLIKNKKIITLIHDLDELRFPEYAEQNRLYFDRVSKITDYFIAHNQKMINYLSLERKIDPKKLYDLKIFDYLHSNSSNDKQIIYDKSVVIAGNLDFSKVSYLKDLSTVSKVKFELYGVNFKESEIGGENIHYNGVFPPEELPSILNKGFGLVWDGKSKNGCTGNTGNYLRFNNPHKLSLYLVSELPVIVWKDSAISEFIEKEGVGFSVGSLDELNLRLNEISETEYQKMVGNAKKISDKLRSGEYLTSVLEEICSNVNF